MSKIAKCMCPNCNNIGTHKVQVFRRGAEGHGFMCDFHYHHLESYFAKNNNMQGKDKAHGLTIGVEFETSFSTEKARIEFLASGYLPTQDSTVDAEFKSPIMNGLNTLSKNCVTFERLISENHLEVNHQCGTHLHIGHKTELTPANLEYIRRFYHSLFVPLSDVMRENPEKTKKLFGRELNYWANPINRNTDPRQHTNFINMQHDKTIEFRTCKFVNAKQYMNCAKFCVAVVEAVINNFVKHFDRTDFDTTRYANITEYRKHKARVTANKLVNLFEKYSNI